MAASTIEGKVALVTGGAKGLGKAIALKLANLGVRVVINYRTSQKMAEEIVQTINGSGGQALASMADVSDIDQVTAMVDRVNNSWGQVDILVNNAGIIKDGLLVRMTDQAWNDVMATNANGTFYCTRAVLKKMLSSRWGRIINIGSVVGLRGNPGQVNYSASKAAIIGFTKALAKEVASRNITVNVVNPGYFETETTSILSRQQKEHWLNLIPQGHFGNAEDIAAMVAFLADENANYITGQVINVDGDSGVLVLEDLGDDLLQDIDTLEPVGLSKRELYSEAMDILVRLQKNPY